MNTYILAIESSCDDTSVAIMQDDELISFGVWDQTLHSKYGGVVPEIASRAHLQAILPSIDHVLCEARITTEDISAIAFTNGPGLLGSLLVGTSFAKGFALAQDIPLIAVNHMEAHILAHMIESPKPEFPFLCLTVSGGHTQIVLVKSPYDIDVLGNTLDDAAGEAFDKAGKIMGLPYPAGPVIDREAKKGKKVYSFPKPKVEGLDFSFSGLKTAFRNFLIKEVKNDSEFVSKNLADICYSYQDAIIEFLLTKLEHAMNQHKVKHIAIAGGVSANSHLRTRFTELAQNYKVTPHIPHIKYCTDNAAMVGIAGYYKYSSKDFVDHRIIPNPRMKI